MIFRKQVKSTFTLTLSKIAVFYKKSEFNRGLVIGLGLTLVFFVGYTAKAALPTTNDIESLNQASYNELFPSGYLKPHEMKFFRYYVDGTNGNNSEVAASGGKIVSGANELVVYDDRADTVVNFEFFTDKINNTIAGEPNIDSCKALNQARSGACGKMISFSYKFYKHIEFFPDSRGVGVSPHMYFYDKDELIKMYVNNAVVPNTGNLQGNALTLIRNLNIDKIFNLKKANAAMSPISYENTEPDIPTSKKYMIVGKISTLINAKILDPRVFKSKSILERSGTSSSYLFTAMTAEPKSKYINNAPTAYDYAGYFNTAVFAEPIDNFYKKEIKKLTLKDTYSFNPTTKVWTALSTPVYREIKSQNLSGGNINVYFYNSSVSNFVNLKTTHKANLIYNVESSAGGFQHMYIYNGKGDSTSTTIHSINLRVGNISNNPCVYSDIPCQSTLEFEESNTNISFSKNRDSLFAFLLPKKVNAQGWQYGDGGFAELASVNTSMKKLIDDGILSGNMFRPSAHFALDNTNKSTLYWKKEVVDFNYNENPVSETPSLFDDLSKDGTGVVHTANIARVLNYKWDRNYEDESKDWSQTAGSLVTHDPTSLRLDLFEYQIKNIGTNDFKFTPKMTNVNGENLFISPNDDDITDNNPPVGKNVFIKACFTKMLEDSCQSIIGLSPDTMSLKMQNYIIQAKNIVFYDAYFNDWDGSSSNKYKKIKLKISIMFKEGTNVTEKSVKYIPIKLLQPTSTWLEPGTVLLE